MAASIVPLADFGELVTESIPTVTGNILLKRLKRPDHALTVSKQCDLWGYVWSSSAVLGDICASVLSLLQEEHRQRCDIVELGCGSGLCSIQSGAVISKHSSGRSRVIATDLVPTALELVHTNAALNGIRTPAVLQTAKMDWGKEGDLAAVLALLQEGQAEGEAEAEGEEAGRLVVGADVLFSSWTVKPVLRAIAALLPRSGSGLGLLVDPGRPPRDEVEGAAGDCGLQVLQRVDYPQGAGGEGAAGAGAGGLHTPIARMRECTVFVLALAAPAPPAASALPLLQAVRQAVLGRLDGPPPTPALPPHHSPGGFGYCLPPVKS